MKIIDTNNIRAIAINTMNGRYVLINATLMSGFFAGGEGEGDINDGCEIGVLLGVGR